MMMQFPVFIPFLIVFSQYQLSASTDILTPHSSCIYIHEEPTTTTTAPGMMMPPPPRDSYHQQFTLRCTEASLEIPTNFNVTQFPSDVRAVFLDCPHDDDDQNDSYCNTVLDNAQPFPELSRLRRVNLQRFAAQNGTRFPMNVLLTNVKQQITELVIQHSKIGRLDAEYFHGFYALTILSLVENDIAEIAPSTFQQISKTPDSSVLRRLRFGFNHVASFDWAVLQPLANSLEWFDLNNQKPGLQNITRSIPKFTFKNSVNLQIYENSLSTIPKEVLDSIDLSPVSNADIDYLELAMENNPFCPLSPNCSCCEMKPFFDWVNSHVRNAKGSISASFVYDCGSLDKIKTYWLTARNASFEIRTGTRLSSSSSSYGYSEKFDPAGVTLC